MDDVRNTDARVRRLPTRIAEKGRFDAHILWQGCAPRAETASGRSASVQWIGHKNQQVDNIEDEWAPHAAAKRAVFQRRFAAPQRRQSRNGAVCFQSTPGSDRKHQQIRHNWNGQNKPVCISCNIRELWERGPARETDALVLSFLLSAASASASLGAYAVLLRHAHVGRGLLRVAGFALTSYDGIPAVHGRAGHGERIALLHDTERYRCLIGLLTDVQAVADDRADLTR